MRICGMEMRSNEIIVVVIDTADMDRRVIDIATKKMPLENDTDQQSLVSFAKAVESFLRDNRVDEVAIKGRGRRGNYAGGPTTFKMEAIVQYVAGRDVIIYPPQTVAAAKRNNDWPALPSLNRYQHEAYYTALTALDSNQ